MTKTFINRPRGVGKTQQLKLFFHENKHKYDTIYVIGQNESSTAQLYNYFKDYHSDVVTCVRGVIRLKKILVLLDEPYLLSIEKQMAIEEELNASDCCDYDMYGIGTVPGANGFARFVK
jgi:hypothetical protein